MWNGEARIQVFCARPALRWLSAALAIVTLVIVPSISIGQASSRRPRKSATQIRRDLRNVQARIQRTRRQIRANRRREHKVTAEIVTVERRLLKTENRLRRSRSRLEVLIDEQKALKKRIEETEKRLLTRRRQLALRLRSNYERGRSGYASVLLGSRSLHDYMSRSYYVGRVVDSDVRLLQEIKADKLQLAADKREVDTKAAEQKRLSASLEDDQVEYTGAVREKQGLLREIRDDRELMIEALEAMERASSTLESDLRALQNTPKGRARASRPWTGSFIKPADGPVTSRFGTRYHPILHRERMHTGVDIGAGYGSPILAADAGEVIFAGYRSGYGNTVLIDHGGNVVTLYGHCSTISVNVGQSVRKGQTIARVGSTGLATGPHLHFEVRRNGSPVNPL